jgi:hypothetical protein
MKQMLKTWLTNGFALRDYYAVANIGDNLHVNVVARLPGVNLNVTDVQWTLAYNPIVIGLSISKEIEKKFREGVVTLTYYWNDGYTDKDKLAEAHVRYRESIDITSDTDVIVLVEAIYAKAFQLSYLRRSVILGWLYFLSRKRAKYFGSLTLNLYTQYAAQFTYPRKVMLIACEADGIPHFFPVDLHAYIPSSSFFWGLRHSNKVIPVLQKIRKAAICFVPAKEYRTLYYLGKFSKGHDDTPISFKKSHLFNFQIPEFVSGYYELELIDDRDIGSQQLFHGKVLHEKKVSNDTAFLYHVHILQALAAYERGQPYTLLG